MRTKNSGRKIKIYDLVEGKKREPINDLLGVYCSAKEILTTTGLRTFYLICFTFKANIYFTEAYLNEKMQMHRFSDIKRQLMIE